MSFKCLFVAICRSSEVFDSVFVCRRDKGLFHQDELAHIDTDLSVLGKPHSFGFDALVTMEQLSSVWRLVRVMQNVNIDCQW